jgi:alpha-mannosidase
MRTVALISVLVLCLFCLPQPATAQNVVVNDIDSILSKGYVENWVVCGPFPPDGDQTLADALQQWRAPFTDTDFLQDVASESLIEPRRGLLHSNPAAPDGQAVWETLAADSPLVDVGDRYPSASAGAIYASCYIGVSADRTAYLDLQTMSGARLWFNHEVVEPTAGADSFLIPIPRGFNLLLIKFGGARFAEMANATQSTEQEVRQHFSLTTKLLGQSSGLAFSLDVASFAAIGTTGVGVIGEPSPTGYFRGPGEIARQEVGVTLYNGSADPVTNMHVSGELTAAEAGDIAPPTSLEPNELRTVLLSFPVSDEMAGSELDARATLMVARERLDVPFSFPVGRIPPPEQKVFLVPGFRPDPASVQDQSDYAASVISSVDQGMLMTEADPAYGLYLPELPYLKIFYDTHPGRREYLRKLVAEGRLSTAGAYNETVAKLIGGEAFIKNILYGHLFHEKVLGDKAGVYVSQDAFGYSAQLPQILAKSGYAGLILSKSPRGFPPVFLQQSLDGTKLPYKQVAESIQSSDELDLRHQLYARLEEQESLGLNADVRFDAGDLDAPTSWFMGKCDALSDFRPPVIVAGSGAELYFDSLQADLSDNKVSLPVTARDASYYHQGAGLSRANLISANRIAENLLVNGSSFATIANLMGATYPDKALDKAWRQVLFAQRHDALAGQTSDRAYLDLMAGYREAIELGTEVLRNSVSYIAESVNTTQNAPSDDARPVVVFNPSSWTRTDCCAVRMEFDDGPEGLALVDSDGQQVPFEVEELERQSDGEITGATLIFVAEDVPSLGYRTYYATGGSSLPEPTVAEGVTIENDYFSINVDPQQGGGIVSLIDLAAGKEFVKPGGAPANEIIALDEDALQQEPSLEIYTTGNKSFSRNFPARVRVESGPVRSRLIVEGDMRNCKRVQEITLYRDVRRIDFVTRLVDYTGKAEMFMVGFPANLAKSVPVFEERFGAVVGKRSSEYMDHRTSWSNNYSGTGLRCAYQWLDASYSGIIDFGEDGGSFPIGMVTLVIPHDDAVRDAALDLQETLIKRGIFCTPSYDDGDIERRRNLPYEDSAEPVDMNEDIQYGTSFRIALGNPAENGYTAGLLAEMPPERKKGFEDRLAGQGYAYMFLKDEGVPEGWEPLPVLIVAGVDANGLRKAVDQLIGDFTEDAVISLPADVNLTEDMSRLDENGLAMANIGAVLNSIENDGTIAMALMRTSSWPGTEWAQPDTLPFAFVPERKTNVFPYAVYPHAGNWRDARVYRFGYEFNNPLIGTAAEMHPGTLPPEASFLEVEPDNLVVTMLKPKGDPTAALQNKPIDAREDGVVVRLYEATGAEAKGKVTFYAPISTAARVDLLENDIGRVQSSENTLSDTVGPFAIQTYSIVPASAIPAVSKHALARDKELVQPIYTRFWRNNAGAAPMGYAPVNITVETGANIGESGATATKVTVNITNDYADTEVSGKAIMVTPPTWRAIPSQFAYDVPPGSAVTQEVVITLPSGPRAGLIKVRIGHDGQVIQDVLEIGDVTLDADVELAGDSIIVVLDNPNADTIEGQVDIITPIEAWSADEVGRFSLLTVTPRVRPFEIAGGEQVNVSFDMTASEGTLPTFWAVARLAYNGHVEYLPIPGHLPTP